MGRRDAEADLQLPPGFRFLPTEEELVVHYLCKKAALLPLPVPIIADVDLYKYDPWHLPEKALFGEKEWYFFTPLDRKYPNGSRPNRAAGSGYWKATGADKTITSSFPSKGVKKRVGVKKVLVFYAGKAPSGSKTNWLMHEYRLADINRPARKKDSLRLHDWVLCRIYNRKFSAEKLALEQKENFNDVPMGTIDEKEMKDQPTSTSVIHSAIEQSNPSFDNLRKLGSSPTCFNAVGSSPMNSNMCFQNLDFFQNSTAPFSGSPIKAPVQNTAFNPISSSQRNCNSTDLILGLHDDFSCSKASLFSEHIWEKEEVESSFRLKNFSQEQQQSLSNFGQEGLQNSFPHLDQICVSDASEDWFSL